MSAFGNVDVHRSLLRELGARYDTEALLNALLLPAVRAGFGEGQRAREAGAQGDAQQPQQHLQREEGDAIGVEEREDSNTSGGPAMVLQEGVALHDLLELCILYTRLTFAHYGNNNDNNSDGGGSNRQAEQGRLRRLLYNMATHTVRGPDLVRTLMQRTTHGRSLDTAPSSSSVGHTTPYTPLAMHDMEVASASSAAATAPPVLLLDDVEQYVVAYCVYLDGLAALWAELFACTSHSSTSTRGDVKVYLPDWGSVLTSARGQWQAQLGQLTQELFYRIAAQQLPLELYALYTLYVALGYRVRLLYCVAQLAVCSAPHVQPVQGALSACAACGLQCEVAELQKLWCSVLQPMGGNGVASEETTSHHTAASRQSCPVHTSCPFMSVLHGLCRSLRGRATLLFSDSFPPLVVSATLSRMTSEAMHGLPAAAAASLQDRHTTGLTDKTATEGSHHTTTVAARASMPSVVSSSSFSRSAMTAAQPQVTIGAHTEEAARANRGKISGGASFLLVYPSPSAADKAHTRNEATDVLRQCGGCVELGGAVEHLLSALAAWPATLLLVTDHGSAAAALSSRTYSTSTSNVPVFPGSATDEVNDVTDSSSDEEEEEEEDTSTRGGMACWTLNAVVPHTRRPASAAQCAEQSGMLLRLLAFRLAGYEDESVSENAEEEREEGRVAFAHAHSAFYVLPLYGKRAHKAQSAAGNSSRGTAGREAKVYLALHLRLTTREERQACEVLRREAGKCWALLRAVQAAMTQQTWCAQAAALCTA